MLGVPKRLCGADGIDVEADHLERHGFVQALEIFAVRVATSVSARPASIVAVLGIPAGSEQIDVTGMNGVERFIAGDAIADIPGLSDMRFVGDEIIFKRGRALRDCGKRFRLVSHALDVAAAKSDYQFYACLFRLGEKSPGV